MSLLAPPTSLDAAAPKGKLEPELKLARVLLAVDVTKEAVGEVVTAFRSAAGTVSLVIGAGAADSKLDFPLLLLPPPPRIFVEPNTRGPLRDSVVVVVVAADFGGRVEEVDTRPNMFPIVN